MKKSDFDQFYIIIEKRLISLKLNTGSTPPSPKIEIDLNPLMPKSTFVPLYNLLFLRKLDF